MNTAAFIADSSSSFTLLRRGLWSGLAWCCRSGAALALVLTMPLVGAAEDVIEQYRFGDTELASVVLGKDGPTDVERKLGPAPCLVPSVSGETVSYLYNVQGADGRHYLRLEVNGQVDAITLSTDPPLTGVCYAPVRGNVPLHTKKGVRLGATTDEVTKLYGKPSETFAVGPLVRYRYAAMLDQPYEWDLVFRNDRLVEWSAVTTE